MKKTYSFTIHLSRDLTDDEVEELYGSSIGDIVSAVINGRPELGCDLVAETLDQAMLRVVGWLETKGIGITSIELDPEEIMALQAA